MEMLISNLLITFGSTFLVIISLWLFSIWIKDISIIDAAFAPIIISLAILICLISQSSYQEKLLYLIPISIWGIRLSYLMLKRKLGHGEDPRYTLLRSWKQPGLEFNLFSLRKVFLLQGSVIWIMTLPMQVGINYLDLGALNFINYFGISMLLIGFLWEAIADYQLEKFKSISENHGKILQSGLWKLSRHPNYFGEIVFWWGLFFVSLSEISILLTIIGPMIYTYLIINVTGVRTMDKKMSKKYNRYPDYIKKTNSLIPKF